MSNAWGRLSTRERRLAGVVAVLLCVAAFWIVLRAASIRLGRLDDEIAGLEDRLAVLKRLQAHGKDLEDAFAVVAEQHSSAWTEEAIHERLRDEIYRLAMKTPPGPGAELAEAARLPAAYLVDIPRLPAGTLDAGEGYREYRIEFDVAPARIGNIVTFLTRLKMSPQALRIERVELGREPESDAVKARIEVTRTIVDAVPGGEEAPQLVPAGAETATDDGNLARNGRFEEWDDTSARCLEWEAEGCHVTRSAFGAADGTAGLEACAGRGGGAVFQWQELTAGKEYDVQLEVAAQGTARFEIASQSGVPFAGSQTIVGDGQTYRYHARFVVPGTPGAPVALRVPVVALDGEGTVVRLNNAVLTRPGQ